MEAAIALPLPTAAATRQLGAMLGQSLPPGSLILLNGNLGSGKTTLVQGLGEGLGITDAVVSPTFTLLNEYPEGRLPLYHFDLYRIRSTEVAELHLETYWEGIEQPLGIVAIEWAERLVQPPLPHLQIDLSLTQTGREARLAAIGELGVALDELLQPLPTQPE